MRPELVPLPWRERPFQERPEDGRFDLLPVRRRRFDQKVKLRFGERQRLGTCEEVAVELRYAGFQARLEAPRVHRPPQVRQRVGQRLPAIAVVFQESGE